MASRYHEIGANKKKQKSSELLSTHRNPVKISNCRSNLTFPVVFKDILACFSRTKNQIEKSFCESFYNIDIKIVNKFRTSGNNYQNSFAVSFFIQIMCFLVSNCSVEKPSQNERRTVRSDRNCTAYSSFSEIK